MQQVARRARRRLHVHRGDEGRARRGEGRAGREAARRSTSRTSSSRSPPRRSRSAQLVDHEIDTYDPYEARGAGVAAVGERRISYDARGLAEPVAEAPRTAVVEDGVATFDARDLTTRHDQPRAASAALRGGHRRGRDPEPAGPRTRSASASSAAAGSRFEGSLGYFGCGLIDGPEIHITGPRRLVGLREHDVGRRRRRRERRLAHRRGACAAATSSSGAASARARASTRRAARSSSAAPSAR